MAVGRAYARLFCAAVRKKNALSTLFTVLIARNPRSHLGLALRAAWPLCARVAFSRDHAGTLGSVSETVAWMSCGTERPGAHCIHRLSSRSALATISRLVTCLCRHACHRLCAADRNTVVSGQVYGSLLVAGCGVQGSICLQTHITMATSRSNINNFTSINLTTERARLSQLWSNALMIASTRHAVTVLHGSIFRVMYASRAFGRYAAYRERWSGCRDRTNAAILHE